jgi:hypothetical protein
MNGKMLVKVTLNEAIDPDLFAYLSQFDNARLRAGAFRALASVAARAKSISTGSADDHVARSIRNVGDPKPFDNATVTGKERLGLLAVEQQQLAAADVPQFLVEDIGAQVANF